MWGGEGWVGVYSGEGVLVCGEESTVVRVE